MINQYPAYIFLAFIFSFASFGTLAKPPVRFALTAGDAHTCAKLDDTVECWGDNYYGQLNVPAAFLESPIQISASGSNSCLIDVFHLHCWGISNELFIAVFEPSVVSIGIEHLCLIDNGEINCLRGANRFGELDIPQDIANPTDLDSGPDGNCAISETASIRCWGRNLYGELNPPEDLGNVELVALGYHHTCALSSGNIRCWGANDLEQTEAPSNLSDVLELDAGLDNTCALTPTRVVCWGSNAFDKSTVPPLTNPIAIAVGTHHTCALADEGIVCWGLNNWGQASRPVSITSAFLAAGARRELLSLPLPLETTSPEKPQSNGSDFVVVPEGQLRDQEISRLIPALHQIIHN